MAGYAESPRFVTFERAPEDVREKSLQSPKPGPREALLGGELALQAPGRGQALLLGRNEQEVLRLLCRVLNCSRDAAHMILLRLADRPGMDLSKLRRACDRLRQQTAQRQEARNKPPNVSIPEIRPRPRYDRFRSGVIDIEVPTGTIGYDPDGEAFSYMLRYYASQGERGEWRNWDLIDRLISNRHYDSPSPTGLYHPWIGFPGGYLKAFVSHVLQIIWAKRALIPPHWPYNQGPQVYTERVCRDIAEALPDVYGTSGLLHFDRRASESGQAEPISCPQYATPLTFLTDGNSTILTMAGQTDYSGITTNRWDFGPERIVYCPNTFLPPATVCDFFLGWGARAYEYCFDVGLDDLVLALDLLQQSRFCGTLALGAFVEPAGAILHEMIHFATGQGSHSAVACCQGGIQHVFIARLRSLFGAPEVSARYHTVDTARASSVRTQSYACDFNGVTLSMNTFFFSACVDGQCIGGDPNAWTDRDQNGLLRIFFSAPCRPQDIPADLLE